MNSIKTAWDRMSHDQSVDLSICMILPSAVRHYRELTFIPPEVEIVSQVSKHGITVLRVFPSCQVTAPERSTEGSETTLFVPMRERVGIITKLFDYARKWGSLNAEFRKRKYDLIFLRNDIAPAILADGLEALYLSWRYGCQIVFQIENPLGQNLASRRLQGRRSDLSARVISRVEEAAVRFLVNRAILVLPINEPLREDLLRIGIEDRKIMVIPEGIKEDRYQHSDGSAIRTELGLDGSKVIVYSGKIDRSRNLRILIEAFAELRKSCKAKLLMVGDGNDRKNLISLVTKLGLPDDVIFTRWVAQDIVPNYIAASDIGICLVPPTDYYLKSSPLKMLEYMAAGRAVIANDEIPEQKWIVSESGGGLLVSYEVPKIAEGLNRLLENTGRLKEYGERGRRWVNAERTYEALSFGLAMHLMGLKKKGG